MTDEQRKAWEYVTRRAASEGPPETWGIGVNCAVLVAVNAELTALREAARNVVETYADLGYVASEFIEQLRAALDQA
jgi:hypothetical protein